MRSQPPSLRYRFDPPTVSALLKLRWWDLPRRIIAELRPLLTDPDVAVLLAALSAENAADGLVD